MAAEAKELRDRIGTLIMRSTVFLPFATTGKLHKSQRYLDDWRNWIDGEMYKRGIEKK